jgi:hypothetical protein
VNPIEQETSLVSEAHQCGGTPDLIAHVKNRIAMVDFTTSKEGDDLPGGEGSACRRRGAGFMHYEFIELDAQWDLLKTLLQAYRFEKA